MNFEIVILYYHVWKKMWYNILIGIIQNTMLMSNYEIHIFQYNIGYFLWVVLNVT